MSTALRIRATSSASLTSRIESTRGRRLRTSRPPNTSSLRRDSSRVVASNGMYSGPAARPMRAARVRRLSATAAVSTGRPMPGNSGTGVHAPIGWTGGSGGLERVCAAATAVNVTATTTNASSRMGPEATARDATRQLDAASAADANYAMPSSSAATAADGARLAARVAELERERTHLLAVIEILKEVSTSLHFIDILQAIARKLGEAFGLDRCSIFLAERGGKSVRLVASYDDPTIRNYMVDLDRYPELNRGMQGGETAFIADAATDPSLKHVKSELI